MRPLELETQPGKYRSIHKVLTRLGTNDSTNLVRKRNIFVSGSLRYKRIAFALQSSEFVGEDRFETVRERLQGRVSQSHKDNSNEGETMKTKMKTHVDISNPPQRPNHRRLRNIVPGIDRQSQNRDTRKRLGRRFALERSSDGSEPRLHRERHGGGE